MFTASSNSVGTIQTPLRSLWLTAQPTSAGILLSDVSDSKDFSQRRLFHLFHLSIKNCFISGGNQSKIFLPLLRLSQKNHRNERRWERGVGWGILPPPPTPSTLLNNCPIRTWYDIMESSNQLPLIRSHNTLCLNTMTWIILVRVCKVLVWLELFPPPPEELCLY